MNQIVQDVMPTITKWILQLTFFCMYFQFPLIGYAMNLGSSEISQSSSKPIYPIFMPPNQWVLVDSSALSPSVLVAYVDRSTTGFLPSINLSIEKTDLSQKEYLREGMLTSIDTTCNWGPVRILQLILISKKTAYILTASAAKEEFATFYPTFKEAFRSLVLTDDLTLLINQKEKKQKLYDNLEAFKQTFKQLNNKTADPLELNALWHTLQQNLQDDYKEMGSYWHVQLLKLLQEQMKVFIELKDG
ncbi:MAG: hypothetical protein NTZ52_05470 [Chlamydiae bacterium]|nr:hypothetical protein [Chlamydiota bacterium]